MALNNLQRLICHKTQTTNQPTQVRQARHVGHRWGSKGKLISNILFLGHSQYSPIRPLTSHHANHPSKASKTCWTLLGKWGQTQKRYSPLDFYTCTHQWWLTSKNLDSSILCNHCMPSRALIKNNGQQGLIAWESQRDLCFQYALIMMNMKSKVVTHFPSMLEVEVWPWNADFLGILTFIIIMSRW